MDNWTSEEKELRLQVEGGLAVVCDIHVNGSYKNLLKWAKANNKFTYIGRRNWHYPASKWQNTPPKTIGHDNAACVEYFINEIYNKRPDLQAVIHELKGQVLGCWCKPDVCHGDFLAEQVNKKEGD